MTNSKKITPPIEAMANFYLLLSRVFTGNINCSILKSLNSIVESECTKRDVASEHFALFGRDVFLWHSFYTSKDRLIGGATQDLYSLCYEKHNLTPKCGENTDHIAHIFAALGEACQTKNAQAIKEITHLLVEFWPFILQGIVNLADEEKSIFLPLAYWTDEMLCLTSEILADFPQLERNTQAEIASDLALDDSKTGLKEIATWLATPAACGINLSPATLQHFAQKFDIPGGFGNRTQITENLLTSLSSYGKLDEFLNFICKQAEQTQSKFEECSKKGSGYADGWQKSWEDLDHAIETMKKQIKGGDNFDNHK